MTSPTYSTPQQSARMAAFPRHSRAMFARLSLFEKGPMRPVLSGHEVNFLANARKRFGAPYRIGRGPFVRIYRFHTGMDCLTIAVCLNGYTLDDACGTRF